jgi:hypothetical protein
MRAILILHDSSPKGYSEIKRDEYPMADPNEPVVFAPGFENYEWLHFNTVSNVPDNYDSRIWKENVNVVGPTTTKHPVYTNINQFRTEITLTKRDAAEIITAIREKEAWANSTLVSSSEKDKLDSLVKLAQQRQLEGIQLSEDELVVIERMKQVGVKTWQNADRANVLIGIVNDGNEPDIDTGWQVDELTANDYPFNGE